jgi:hypothetical protein
MTRRCKVEGCEGIVKRDGFELCYACWKTRDQLVKSTRLATSRTAWSRRKMRGRRLR